MLFTKEKKLVLIKQTVWSKFCSNKEIPALCLKTFSCDGCTRDLNPPHFKDSYCAIV